MKQQFLNWRPSGKSAGLLLKVGEILTSYEAQGYHLTIRQLYYQLVAGDVIANNLRSYHAIVNLVSQGRLSGLIDWDMIEDRVRIPVQNTHWESPEQIIKAAANSYYNSRWKGQDNYIEVWCEKDAISNIVEPVCRKWDVLFLANRGYSSQSAMYDAHKRFVRKSQEGKKLGLIYLGDHDPSGLDMTSDIRGRMGLFLHGGGDFEGVSRIALNMDQVRKYDPPENPAKITDSRYRKYVDEYGEASWELDALEPSVLAELVETAILSVLNQTKFRKIAATEKKVKANLLELAEVIDANGVLNV